MSSQSRIVELSSRIAANTAKLDAYLVANNLPSPSFDEDGPPDTLVPKAETEIERARVAIIDDTQELRNLVLGPREYLMSFCHNELISQQVITRFSLAQAVPVGGTATFSSIASGTGLPEVNVRQVIRHATVRHIFKEPSPGVVAHSAASRLLSEDESMHDWVATSTGDLLQGASQVCNAFTQWPGSQEPNETGFALAHNTDKPIYQFFEEEPESGRRFANAMTSYTQETGYEISHVVDNFPWASLSPGAVVVDVGGSQGHVAFALARAFPSLSFTVQDLPKVIEEAEKSVSGDVANRIKFMAHDFLTEQPVRGADVYFFRWIFHNWSDGYCLRILRCLVPALKTGAKILINDDVLPAPGSISRWREARFRSMDLTMTEIQNSRMRDLEDWRHLISSAGPNFKLQEATQPPGSNLWLIVVEWMGPTGY